MRLLKISLLAIVFFFVPGFSLANNNLVSFELESLVTAGNIAASKDSESIEDLMKTMHPESPYFVESKIMAEKVFPTSDMDVSTVEFHFIGLSGDYAISQVKIKIKKINGPASFKNHVGEHLYVFKKDQEKWKIWHGAVLDIDFL